ncbi:carbon-nitrogen hydrolase family protein [uncultured Gimesia sp.]|uniref:carbon-nitrogen hydrolase family protein n=1 Tax=uncultured Gimesia sp. TaxID=1678688 RepID=UPI002609F3BC|nr:carbon-nitrogen hydrolase family protein [uncultured Gimesia sp.]
MNLCVTVAACQLIDIQDDLEQSLDRIIDYATRAAGQGAQLVCFPECYLQGYVVRESTARQRAIDLSSVAFKNILKRLAVVQPLLVIGMIEQEGDKIYITAVVVRQGELLGRYRKSRLAPFESIFEPGEKVPIFEVEGLRFGINICYELNFSECAAAIANQNAHLMVCPCYNMLSNANAERWKFKHNAIRAERIVETGLWLISADVTGERDGQISYGPTALIDPNGTVVAQVPLMEEGLVVQEICY